jgi:hypothetical protein
MNIRIFILLVVMGIVIGALGLFSSVSNGLYERGMFAGLLLVLAILALIMVLVSRKKTHR